MPESARTSAGIGTSSAGIGTALLTSINQEPILTDAREGRSVGPPSASSIAPKSSVDRGSSPDTPEPTPTEREHIREVLDAVAEARRATGWRALAKGFDVHADGLFVLERLRAGAELRTLLAAPWALARDAATSTKPAVRAGRYVRPGTLFRASNWHRWIEAAALSWLDEQDPRRASKPAPTSDGSIALGMEIEL